VLAISIHFSLIVHFKSTYMKEIRGLGTKKNLLTKFDGRLLHIIKLSIQSYVKNKAE